MRKSWLRKLLVVGGCAALLAGFATSLAPEVHARQVIGNPRDCLDPELCNPTNNYCFSLTAGQCQPSGIACPVATNTCKDTNTDPDTTLCDCAP